MGRSFVGFGFGPIQSGLFLLEAFRAGGFERFTVAEVDEATVAALRAADGCYTVNVAHADRIEQVTVEGVEVLNPTVSDDRKLLTERLRAAEEVATALPSIAFYDRGVASLLAEGSARRDDNHPQIVYTAENHNHAAETLEAAMTRCLGRPPRGVQVLNTVIGKMSGVINDATTIGRLGLATLTPGTPRAVLVEAFNRILITRITLPGGSCGIPCFVEKPDLLPFEEAKLYGHNAVHALLAYLAHARGLTAMSQVAAHADLMDIARGAFLDECGGALCRKHAGVDTLFTPAGFEAYAMDLLTRMTNPHLHDQVERVIRDPQRKLGWDDRLHGTMRLALAHGVRPRCLAQGAAAAAQHLGDVSSKPKLAALLRGLWHEHAGEAMADRLIDLTWEALQ
mgnify:CR=1 FL=1